MHALNTSSGTNIIDTLLALLRSGLIIFMHQTTTIVLDTSNTISAQPFKLRHPTNLSDYVIYVSASTLTFYDSYISTCATHKQSANASPCCAMTHRISASSFAIRKSLKSKPGPTWQPSKAYSPKGRAACHTPAGTTWMGAAPLAEKRPSASVLAWELLASKHNSSSASPSRWLHISNEHRPCGRCVRRMRYNQDN